MLAAIGVVLILKQIPHAIGYDIDYEGDMGFFQKDRENTFSEIFNRFLPFYTRRDHFVYGCPGFNFNLGKVQTT